MLHNDQSKMLFSERELREKCLTNTQTFHAGNKNQFGVQIISTCMLQLETCRHYLQFLPNSYKLTRPFVSPTYFLAL